MSSGSSSSSVESVGLFVEEGSNGHAVMAEAGEQRIDEMPEAGKSTETKDDMQFRRYDRQIRIWGIEAQRRISQSSVLLVGALSPTGNEVAKNLVLTGISRLFILKQDKASIHDASFFLQNVNQVEDIETYFVGQLKILNPSVTIELVSEPMAADCVVHCNWFSKEELIVWNERSRSLGSSLFIHVSVKSYIGLVFSQQFISDKHKPFQELITDKIMEEIEERSKQDEHAATASVASIVGGAATQDVLNVVGGTGGSTPGLYLFDGSDFSSRLYASR